jgi:hypothetical protein
LEQNIQPHIPVIDRRHQTQGHFTREQFRYEPKENAYYCPEGKALLSRSIAQQSGLSVLLDRSAMSRVSAEEIYVPRVSIEKYLFIGRSQRDKQFARWQVRLNISTLNERGTRSRACSRSQAVATTQHRVTDVGRRQYPKTQGLEEAPQALQENSRRAASRFRPPQFSTDSHKFIGGLVSHEN